MVRLEVRFDVIDEFDISVGDVKGCIDVRKVPRIGEPMDIMGEELLERFGYDKEPQRVEAVAEGAVEPGAHGSIYLSNFTIKDRGLVGELSQVLDEKFGMFLWPHGDSRPTGDAGR